MIGLSTYVCVYILNLPFCTNVYSTSLLNGTKKYIEIPKPSVYQSRIQKKKDSMNQYFGLSSKEIITRFSVFFVLIVKQRRYFGKKDRLICLWKSPWEGIPSPKFIWAKYVAFYSCSFFYLSYSNHTFQCWTGGFTLMRRNVFSRREDLLGSSHRWMKVWMKIHEVFVHARITVKGRGGGDSEILSYFHWYVTQINIIL